MILEAKNITYGYKKNQEPVIKNFNLVAKSQERVGILAPSGFGKTTLCQLLSGYLYPNSGEVLLDGKPLPKKGYCPVQMIWQHPERVVNPRMRMGDTLEEGFEISSRIIEGLGIEKDWYNRYPGEISGGEMQRFCIARALGEKTKFILADEISTMLDLITQSQIWNFLLQEVEERGIGLIAVTHSDSLMNRVATRVVNLDSNIEQDLI
ncbi:MAG: ATP-binding cassette domain-containing protein [Clostridiales bacterium]